MKKTRSVLIAAAMLMLMLTLSGCGEGKKYAQAAALEAEGKDFEAYQIYDELGEKRYQDAAQKAKEMRKAAMSAAETALAEGRYEDAEALAAPFPRSRDKERILAYAENAKNGSYVQGLTLSEDGRLSFTAAIGPDAGGTDGQPRLEVVLETWPNGRASGTVHTAEKKENSPEGTCFVPEDYLSGGRYVVTDAPIGAWTYAAEPKGLTIADFDELDSDTLRTLQTLQWAHFPIAYEAIMNDGTHGALLTEWSCSSLRFRDPMQTFAGGTLTVRLVSEDGKTVIFDQSAAIPASEAA